jgi:MSHA biogenesis protein MshE
METEMLPAPKSAWLPLGALLMRENLITPEQLELALVDQHETGLRLGELLVGWGWVDSAAVSRALAEQYEMDFVDLDATEVDADAAALLPARDAHRYGAIPIRFVDEGRLLVGVANPTEVGACDELRQLLGVPISLVVVDQAALNRALAAEYA